MKNTAPVIENEFWRCSFLPHMGGAVERLMYKNPAGHAVDLWRPTPESAVTARDTASFPLFPFCGRIVGGQFSHAGKTYRLPFNLPPQPHAIHGASFQNPWTYDRDADGQGIVLSHAYSVADYAFCYRAEQRWRLHGAEITLTLSIQNTGTEPMPMGMGIHPYFKRTPQCWIRASVGRVIMNAPDVTPIRVEDVPPAWDFSRTVRVAKTSMDNCFTGLNGTVSLGWPEESLRLDMTSDPVFRNLVVYAPADGDFFCVEPWTHHTDSFNGILRREALLSDADIVVPQQTLTGTIRLLQRRDG